jgi:integrase/recombinase XerD
MIDLDRQVADYLRLRRALGFKLYHEGLWLPQLVAYLHAAGSATLSADLAISWARAPQHIAPITCSHRLGAARRFATYLKTIDPATEIPPRGVFPGRAPRPTPYLWADRDVARLLAAARAFTSPLCAATHEAFFGLLAVAGLRVGEGLRLERTDVDLTAGVLTIREPKFGRTRLVPLHPSATDALRSYAESRDRWCPAPAAGTFFVTPTGTALTYNGVRATFVELTTGLGLRTSTVKPRMHDLRHGFAVNTLVDAYRTGTDVSARMAVLSTYLGHVNPASTYWYLSNSPELMGLVAARLDDRFGGPR